MIVSAGIDIGSSAVKVALFRSKRGGGRRRDDAELLSCSVERTRRRDQRQVVDHAYDSALELAGVQRDDVHYVATTGEGELVDFRTGHFYGMTAHARGAVFLDPEARAALDVGALHGRAMRFDERAKVLSYRMTSQCASGSGQFLENIARYLGANLEEVGPLSLEGNKPEKVSGICAVLAETDVINMVSRGITIPNILRGIHESMAFRLLKLLRATKSEGVVLLTGGLSADVGLLHCLRHPPVRKNRKPVLVDVRSHERAIYAGAIGAALWGAFRCERLNEGRAA
jgi:benzoyl-CoA reductase subunit D